MNALLGAAAADAAIPWSTLQNLPLQCHTVPTDTLHSPSHLLTLLTRAPWLLQSTHKVCSLMFQLRWKFTLGSIEHNIVKFSAVFGARLGECIRRGRGMWGNVRVSTLSEMWCDMRPLPPHTYNPVHAPTQNRHTCLSFKLFPPHPHTSQCMLPLKTHVPF